MKYRDRLLIVSCVGLIASAIGEIYKWLFDNMATASIANEYYLRMISFSNWCDIILIISIVGIIWFGMLMDPIIWFMQRCVAKNKP